jgi:hypothetical protein
VAAKESGSDTKLSREEWTGRARRHHERVDAWIGDRLERRARGAKHPVDDFLFDYYPYSPARLRRWHPGPGVMLEGRAAEPLEVPGFTYTDAYGVTSFDPEALSPQQRQRLSVEIGNTRRLLENVQDRPGRFGCFGLHEWAMVLGLEAEEVRHSSWPLRVTPEQIRSTIDEVGLRCTHFDAFRFFTPEAVALNPLSLSRANQVDTDQAGCLHATMDLYKYAMRLQPLIPMDLVADAFALARDVRMLDMQGAPYDMADLGVAPIPLETAEGRREFARIQRDQSDRGRQLRERLLSAVGFAVESAGPYFVTDSDHDVTESLRMP